MHLYPASPLLAAAGCRQRMPALQPSAYREADVAAAKLSRVPRTCGGNHKCWLAAISAAAAKEGCGGEAAQLSAGGWRGIRREMLAGYLQKTAVWRPSPRIPKRTKYLYAGNAGGDLRTICR